MSRAVVFCALLLGCSWGTISDQEFKDEYGFSPKGGQKEVNVFASYGLTQCLDKLRAAVGTSDVQATALTLYPTYALLTARSPRNPQNVDSYDCRHGEVGPSTPVKLWSSAQKTLDADTFLFSDVDFGRLPALIASATSDVGIADGKATSASIRKSAGEVRVTISVTGKRNDGRIEYDGKGNRIVAAAPAPAPSVTATTKVSRGWMPRDAPELAGPTRIDPLGKALAWGTKVATAWKSDAVFYWLKATDPAPDGSVDLTHGYVELWFASPACLAANAADDCGLNLFIDKKAPGGQASFAPIAVTGPHDGVGPVRCTLRQAIAAATKVDPGFRCSVADLHVLGTATWVLNARVFIDATTCGPGRR